MKQFGKKEFYALNSIELEEINGGATYKIVSYIDDSGDKKYRIIAIN